MSVKFALLALLSRGPSTAYQLRKDFDATTSQTWPLNIGQVSTTLQRLRRDGLVAQVSTGRDHDRLVGGSGDEHGTVTEPWQLTAEGHAELDSWWQRPVSRQHRGRDELVVKLALAVIVPGVDVTALVQAQRAAVQRLLHDVTRVRRDVDAADVTARLVLDSHIFQSEAELRWLDAVEETVARASELPSRGALSMVAPARVLR